MRMMQAVLTMLALAGCATVMQPAGPNYYVMRHLQKAAGADPALTEEGAANAQRLIAHFAGDPPSAIYASPARRARLTAAPLAAKLGLTPKSYDPADTPALVARVKAEPGTALIVGHSNTVPDIVVRLGGTRPADIADDRYGDIWQVSGPAATVTHARLYP